MLGRGWSARRCKCCSRGHGTRTFAWDFVPDESHVKSTVASAARFLNLPPTGAPIIAFLLLFVSSAPLEAAANRKARASTTEYFDPHEVRRRTLSRILYSKFNYLFDF